jgi:hypothetical protein
VSSGECARQQQQLMLTKIRKVETGVSLSLTLTYLYLHKHKKSKKKKKKKKSSLRETELEKQLNPLLHHLYLLHLCLHIDNTLKSGKFYNRDVILPSHTFQ